MARLLTRITGDRADVLVHMNMWTNKYSVEIETTLFDTEFYNNWHDACDRAIWLADNFDPYIPALIVEYGEGFAQY
jgi:hypothetical protein